MQCRCLGHICNMPVIVTCESQSTTRSFATCCALTINNIIYIQTIKCNFVQMSRSGKNYLVVFLIKYEVVRAHPLTEA